MEKTRDNRGKNPNSLKNLKPQKAGEPSHNPKGRPHKADCLLECIKEELSKVSLSPGLTNEQLTAAVLVKMGTQGNLKAIELEMAYLHAKPNTKIDVNTKGLLELLVRWDGNRGLDAVKQG